MTFILEKIRTKMSRIPNTAVSYLSEASVARIALNGILFQPGRELADGSRAEVEGGISWPAQQDKGHARLGQSLDERARVQVGPVLQHQPVHLQDHVTHLHSTLSC